MANPNDALLNGETVDFTQFHKNSTHSWIRIDPHEKGLVKILDTTEKTEEGGGCLIATATHGTEMAPQVQLLREIRDNQLMNIDSGVSFMTGFNTLYYSFSPFVADLERENPWFKEMVKIGITPLLTSLYFMEFAETEGEILGIGISVILMNIGMYFVFPFAICYQSMRFIRTRGVKKSNWEVISSCNVRSVLKIGLLGLIALFVLSVSVPSAFAQSTESEGQNPIQVILDISYENIQESLEGVTDPGAQALFEDGEAQYIIAMKALEDGEIEKAEESALLAMQYFEDSAKEIGELLEAQEATIQPLGLSTAAASIFNVQEGITNTDNETNELRELVKLNNFDDVDFSEYEESVNLAKTLLADGFVPDAQAQLELANSIKDNLYEQIGDATNAEAAEDIKERLGEQENLGLTIKEIRELETILEDINDETTDNGDDAPGNSGDAPGQNKADSEDDAPGNSGDAPGQNKENDNGINNQFESPEDIPGFGSASDIGKENGQGKGLGLGDIGNIPPGLAKLFGLDGTGDDTDDGETVEGLPPGLSNNPPGQAKKLDYSEFRTYSPDDYFDDDIGEEIEVSFEESYDKLYKDSKSKEKKYKEILAGIANAKGNEKGGNPNCDNEGVTDNDPTNTSGLVNQPYTIDDFTAVGSSCQTGDPAQITIQVSGPNPPPIANLRNGDSFTPDEVGIWTITATFQGQFETREVIVTQSLPSFEVRIAPDTYTSDFTTNIDLSAPGNNNYNLGSIENIDCGVFNCTSERTIDPALTDGQDPPAPGTYTTTYRVYDDDSPVKSTTITETIEVIQS
jgi:hypothetical protein